jgi:outer membrane protein OmpA-like peptidoglycan-associated protein
VLIAVIVALSRSDSGTAKPEQAAGKDGGVSAKAMGGVGEPKAAVGKSPPTDSQTENNPDGSTAAKIESDTVTLPLVFEAGSAEFRVSDPERLQEIIANARSELRKSPKRRIELTGHASKEGPANLNATLGRDRAQAVSDLLIAKGISATKMIITSLGAEDAVDKGERSRRVTLRLVDDFR